MNAVIKQRFHFLIATHHRMKEKGVVNEGIYDWHGHGPVLRFLSGGEPWPETWPDLKAGSLAMEHARLKEETNKLRRRMKVFEEKAEQLSETNTRLKSEKQRLNTELARLLGEAKP